MPPSVYPTGTTIYEPEKCWNGYTLFGSELHRNNGRGAVLIDMNGNVVKRWQGLDGFPNKMLPGGHIMGGTEVRNPKYGFQDMVDLVEADWDGKIIWRFDRYELVKDPRQKARWMSRQHHDYQREGNPVGYYVPGMEFKAGGKTLMLCHKNLKNPKISDKILLDDAIIEVDRRGKIIWEWICSEHYEEMGFSTSAKRTIKRNPGISPMWGKAGDWMHMNSISKLGPNKFFDKGNKRFHPDNIILSGRQTNIVAIIDRKTGKIIWQLGPYFTATKALRKIGQIIGQHHAHMIPRGLPGEGNILLFDNGGAAGYGVSNPTSLDGTNNAKRDFSRILEIDPLTLEIKWQYPAPGPGPGSGRLYSSFVCSAQRLPNGNTLITEGNGGRIIEITPAQEIVWEYISPYKHRRMKNTLIYRAYRVPYEWAPMERPQEIPIKHINNSKFRVPRSPKRKRERVTTIK